MPVLTRTSTLSIHEIMCVRARTHVYMHLPCNLIRHARPTPRHDQRGQKKIKVNKESPSPLVYDALSLTLALSRPLPPLFLPLQNISQLASFGLHGRWKPQGQHGEGLYIHFLLCFCFPQHLPFSLQASPPPEYWETTSRRSVLERVLLPKP